jgi:hypothetical protein
MGPTVNESSLTRTLIFHSYSQIGLRVFCIQSQSVNNNREWPILTSFIVEKYVGSTLNIFHYIFTQFWNTYFDPCFSLGIVCC